MIPDNRMKNFIQKIIRLNEFLNNLRANQQHIQVIKTDNLSSNCLNLLQTHVKN